MPISIIVSLVLSLSSCDNNTDNNKLCGIWKQILINDSSVNSNKIDARITFLQDNTLLYSTQTKDRPNTQRIIKGKYVIKDDHIEIVYENDINIYTGKYIDKNLIITNNKNIIQTFERE